MKHSGDPPGKRRFKLIQRIASILFMAAAALLSGCQARTFFVIDPYFDAAILHPRDLRSRLQDVARHNGRRLDMVVLAPDDDVADRLKKTVGGKAGRILFLSPMAALLSIEAVREMPETHFIFLGVKPDGAMENVTVLPLDRTSAFEQMGERVATRSAENTEVPFYALFLADNAVRRAELDAFRQGLSSAAIPENDRITFLVKNTPPPREELRRQITDLDLSNASGCAVFMGDLTPFVLELLRASGTAIYTENVALSGLYSDQIRSSIEVDYGAAVEQVFESLRDGTPQAEGVLPAFVTTTAGQNHPVLAKGESGR